MSDGDESSVLESAKRRRREDGQVCSRRNATLREIAERTLL